MGEGRIRPARENRLRSTRALIETRPDRPALWALLLAVALLALVTISAQAQAAPSTGGASVNGGAYPFKTRAGSMRVGGATWYGPGLYGNHTACGRVLRPGTVGVAHKSLPCGTRVVFVHQGRVLVTRVIDRGPYAAGYQWDLTNGARLRLGFDGAGRIRYTVARRSGRRPAARHRRARRHRHR